MHPRVREFYADRDRVLRERIAHLRAAWGTRPDGRSLTGRGDKVLRHPGAGELALRFETLRPLQDPAHLLVIYRAADDVGRSALDGLCAR